MFYMVKHYPQKNKATVKNKTVLQYVIVANAKIRVMYQNLF